MSSLDQLGSKSSASQPSVNQPASTLNSICKSVYEIPEDVVLSMILYADLKEEKLDQYNLCRKNQCTKLTIPEIKRQGSLKDKFSLNINDDQEIAFCNKTGTCWRMFAEGSRMYCLLCRTHDTMNNQNKSKTYNKDPSTRLKQIAVTDHAKSKMHRAAIEAELTSRVSIFHKEVTEKEKSSDEVLLAVF